MEFSDHNDRINTRGLLVLWCFAVASLGLWNIVTLLPLGFVLIVIGGSMNFLVIRKNNGQMPVCAKYMGKNETRRLEKSPTHCVATKDTKMKILYDRIRVAGGVASIGDIVVLTGCIFSILGVGETMYNMFSKIIEITS